MCLVRPLSLRRLRLRRRGAAICLTLALAGCAAAPERAGEPLPAPLPPPVAAPPIAEVPPLPPVVVRAPDPFPAAAGAELNIARWMRMDALLGYRATGGLDTPYVGPSTARGPIFALHVGFGKY